jgi:hypothetical protein
MHWPGASYLFIIGTLVPVLVFLPVYLYFYFREKEEPLNNFLYIIFFLVVLAGMGALLAVGVSKNVLTDIIRISESINITKYYKIKSKINQKSNISEVEQISDKTIYLLNYINDLKIEMLLKASEENQDAITEAKEIRLWQIQNKDFEEAVREVMLYSDKVVLLSENLEKYYSYLISFPEIEKAKSADFIKQLSKLNIDTDEDEIIYCDELNFHVNLILAIHKLTEIENMVRLAELEAISILNETVSEEIPDLTFAAPDFKSGTAKTFKFEAFNLLFFEKDIKI